MTVPITGRLGDTAAHFCASKTSATVTLARSGYGDQNVSLDNGETCGRGLQTERCDADATAYHSEPTPVVRTCDTSTL